MTTYSKYNIIYRLQRWMDSVPGQTFLNYAYSWGASVVILGTLFKLTHLPGANLMLFLGMGTEVVVFFLSAFDRPFDKTADGRDLPTHVGEETEDSEEETVRTAAQPAIVIGGKTAWQKEAKGTQAPAAAGAPEAGAQTAAAAAALAGGTVVLGGGSNASEMQDAETSSAMAEATSNYVEELKNLTEMLGKVSEQSKRLTTDSEEMENLNRTLTGICKIYEMQLKSASSQIGTIDEINAQTRKMASQIEQLNKIYTRMIEAMTINMKVAAPNAKVDLE